MAITVGSNYVLVKAGSRSDKKVKFCITMVFVGLSCHDDSSDDSFTVCNIKVQKWSWIFLRHYFLVVFVHHKLGKYLYLKI